MTEPTRYGLVGAGHRAELYVRAIAGAHADVAALVGIADTNPGRAEYHADLLESLGAARPAIRRADEVAAMIRDERIARVVVTSPDHTHAGVVVTALLAGADVVVEKPLATDPDGAAAIARAVAETGRSVVATFNYRYSPRNSALKQAIASGAIGRPTAVHFEWVLDTAHGADYFRRWHREKANSGGLLVHKASHHFDLVNWWLADVPERVYASGGLRFYGDANARDRGLGERPERGTGAPADPFGLDLRDDERLRRLYLDNEAHDGYLRDRDVFSPGITIEDTISAVVDYRGGASMSYSLVAYAPWEGYRVAVTGTEGRAELEVVERSAVLQHGGRIVDPSAVTDETAASGVRPRGERLVVQRHWEAAREVPIVAREGGHGGGDALLLSDVFVGARDDELGRAADYRDGMRAIAVGIAANRSLDTGLPVRTDELGLGVDLGSGRPEARR
jgi:predicted dehydrogenase